MQEPAKRKPRKKKTYRGDAHWLVRETPDDRYRYTIAMVLAARRLADDYRFSQPASAVQSVFVPPVRAELPLSERLAVWWCQRRHKKTIFNGGATYRCGDCNRIYDVPWADPILDPRSYQRPVFNLPADVSLPEIIPVSPYAHLETTVDLETV